MTKRQSSQWKHAGSPRPKKARQSKSTHKLLMIPFFDSTGMIYMHWVPTGQSVNNEYYVEVLREFRKRFRQKRPALFKSDQWHFQQDNAPVINSILITNYLTKILFTNPSARARYDTRSIFKWSSTGLNSEFDQDRHQDSLSPSL